MRLYVVRHADPDYSTGHITEQGHLEAAALAKWFKGIGLHRIYSSPILRARETAQYTADALGLPVDVEDWSREIGLRVNQHPWGDLHISDVPGEFIRSDRPYPTHDDWHTREPYANSGCVEEMDELKVGSDSFLTRQGYVREGGRYRLAPGNQDRVAVFCHLALGKAWLAHLLELPPSLVWAGFWLAPSSVSTILFNERSDDWAVPCCLSMGETAHLYAEGLPISHRGLYGNLE